MSNSTPNTPNLDAFDAATALVAAPVDQGGLGGTVISETEHVRLLGAGDWDAMQHSVRPLLFGEIVKRATPIIQQYQSDLYHDALFIQSRVNGPCEIDLVLRTCGTTIALASDEINMALGMASVEVNHETTVLYRVALYCDDRYDVGDGTWFASFTIMPKVVI